MCIGCFLSGKNDIRLGKLIDKKVKCMASAKTCHPWILTVGIKVGFAKYQPEIFRLKSVTPTLKWSF